MFNSELRAELKLIQAKLKEPFLPSVHQIRELPGKGYWAFVSHQVIRQRLDEVVPEWQADFSPVERLENDVVCRCGITILGIRKEAIGSVPLIAATNKDGKDVSRGSAADRVAAESLKNACEFWGVGLYLDDQAFVANYLNKHSSELTEEVKSKLRSLIAYLRTKGDLPPVNSSVSVSPIPKTQAPTTKRKVGAEETSDPNFVREPKPPSMHSQPDRDLLIREIDSLCKRKNITPDRGSELLIELYGVKGRSQLTDEQLVSFRDYLSIRAAV
ncbi:MAG: Rad52/Rad22 family DNA repair protein [Nostoc sp. ChiSLP01]|nr:Rad52/Rad22 family DNA repair protein [Nostoc sp. CmiSLP01]MDZ8285254.1 Rad52/Rad22 family DNA repair protein [Nostoc sp. ChiSLP01]